MALPRNNCSTCRYKISENKSSDPLKTHQHLTAETLTNAIKIPRYDKAVRDLYLTVSWGLLDLNVDVEGLEGDGNGMLPVLVTYYYVWRESSWTAIGLNIFYGLLLSCEFCSN